MLFRSDPYRQFKMVKFIGTYEAKLDDKGRVVVPAAYKSLSTLGVLYPALMGFVNISRRGLSRVAYPNTRQCESPHVG